MDEEDLLLVPKTIKDYVDIAGGKVALEALKSDFRKAYNSTIPYADLGYPDIYSFLRSVRGIHVQEHDDDFYLISNSRRKNYPVPKNDEIDDVANITIQLNKNLVIGDKVGKRKITLKSSGNTNMNARKSILDKMNLYSSSAIENSSSKVNETQNNETLSNCTETSETYSDYIDTPSLYSNDISNGDQDVFNSPNVYDSSAYFPSQSISVDCSSSSNYFASQPISVDCSSSSNYFASQPISADCSSSSNYFASLPTSVDSSSSNPLPSYTQNPYYLLLINFVGKYSLEIPVFETRTNVSPDSDGITYNTILKIGNDNFISPTYYDLSQSNSVCGNLLKTAYESLKNKYDYTYVNPQPNIVSSILEIINSYKTGLNSEFIKAVYIQKYNIAPPINWIQLIESTSAVYIEPLSNQIMIYPYRSFLSITPYSSSLPDRIFPITDTWNIFISNCVNTNEVWFRILDEDYERKYRILLSEMNKHYDRSVVSEIKSVNVGELYACFYEQNWYRAEVLSTRGNMAECRMIDTGIKTEFLFPALFPLNNKFTNTPPLAFRCSMAGLSKYAQMKYISCQLIQIINNEVATGKVNTEITNELSMDVYLKNRAFNVSVNKFVLNKIKNELNVPKLMNIGEVFNIYLLSVDDSGVARVQIESRSLQLLQHALDCASKAIEQDGNRRSFYITSFSNLDLEKIYLIQLDKRWKRIMIKTLLSGNKANVLCIDTGDCKVIDTKNIVCTDSLPDTLIHISPQYQAVKVSVSDNTTKKMISFMDRFCAKTNVRNATLTMRILRIESDPVVQLCKRISNDEMIPLKDIFLEKCEQVTSINFVNNLSNILPDNLIFDLFNNASSSVIPKLELKKGEVKKAVVLKALTPTNFILKIENQPRFAEFMLDFNNYHNLFSPAPVSSVCIGQCYAVQLENCIWYRGLALFVMDDTVVVRLVDFGEAVTIPMTAIFNTMQEFALFPAQTVNAKLMNVKPIRGEWTQQDCYRFKEIVYQKILNCVIVDCTDTLFKVLLLDDTNHRETINVTSVLLQEKRAVLEEI